MQWYFTPKSWAKVTGHQGFENKVIEHRSIILRPLKDVQMYLQENKRKNLQLAIERVNGCIIKPGETFSFWKLAGRPTAKKGYLEGMVLNQGKIEAGIGGGLCQLGNLMFWMAAHSPLTVVERHRHGFDVFPDIKRTVPFGSGATLSYNYIDLQLKNDTDNSFCINLWLSETHLHGCLSSLHALDDHYSVEERGHQIQLQYWGGYSRHNQIYRIRTTTNGQKEEELLVENHAIMMYNPFLSA